MKQDIQVGSAFASPGMTANGVIAAGELANGEHITLPVIVINGANPGPCVWVNAALHGNEVNGVMTALRVARGVDAKTLHGSIIVTPISNPLAFQARTRLTPHDGGNLGESYEGDPAGSITRQIAFAHFQEVQKHAEYMIDLHAAGVTNRSKPYSVLKYAGHRETEARALDLLLKMGIFLNCAVDTLEKNDEPVPLTGSLDMVCMARGIPAFMLELGHSGRVEEAVIAAAYEGIRNGLRHLKMVDGDTIDFPDSVLTTQRYLVRCQKSGLVVQRKDPHDFVKQGECLAVIVDRFGLVLEEIFAPKDLYIISVKEDCVASAGDRVAFCAS
jgi:predicted deacylase